MTLSARIEKTLAPISGTGKPFSLNIELQAEAGITVLLGPSGSGKTLTLNCIAGFARPDQGRIEVNGEIYFDAGARVHLPPEQRHCGYMFQEDALFPHMTVVENLRFGAASRKLRGLQQRRRIGQLVNAFGLTGLENHKPAQLSGGQKQRTALARILIGEPRLILLDEPTRGLDARLRESFYQIVKELEVPLLLVTHDLEECFALADQVCLIDAGRFLQSGPAGKVLAQPASVNVADFLGLYVTVPAEIKALDPGRNQSRLKVSDFEIMGPYLPGHLIGDRGHLCVRNSELQVRPLLESKPGANELRLLKQSAAAAAGGVRVRFEGGFQAVVSETEYEQVRSLEHLAVKIPPAAVRFLAK